MAFDQAAVLALLGLNFYLLYLNTTIERNHKTLKLFLMLTSFFTVFITLGFVVEVVEADAAANAAMLSIIERAYMVYVWLMIGFIAYWFFFVLGTVANNLWLNKRNRLPTKKNRGNFQ